MACPEIAPPLPRGRRNTGAGSDLGAGLAAAKRRESLPRFIQRTHLAQVSIHGGFQWFPVISSHSLITENKALKFHWEYQRIGRPKKGEKRIIEEQGRKP